PVTGDITMALAECGRSPLDPQDCVDFPAPGQRVRVGEKVTQRRDGTIVRGTFTPGSSLLNEVQVPAGAGRGGGPAPAGAAFKSADDCIQQKAINEGMEFGKALAECALAMAPPPTPTTPPAPPPPQQPPVVVAAAVDPSVTDSSAALAAAAGED